MQLPDRWATVMHTIDQDVAATVHLPFDDILNWSPDKLQKLQRVWDASLVNRHTYTNPNAVVAAILKAIAAGKMSLQRRSYSGRGGAPLFSPELFARQRSLLAEKQATATSLKE